MNIEGKWEGYYEYGVGYELPFFSSRVQIEVDFIIDNEEKFTGTVTETPSEFSVPETAKINGFIDKGLISFIKSYDVNPQINSENNTVEILEGKLEIQHTGLIDEQNSAIYGEWLIEETFVDEEGYNDVEFFTGIWLLKKK